MSVEWRGTQRSLLVWFVCICATYACICHMRIAAYAEHMRAYVTTYAGICLPMPLCVVMVSACVQRTYAGHMRDICELGTPTFTTAMRGICHMQGAYAGICHMRTGLILNRTNYEPN